MPNNLYPPKNLHSKNDREEQPEGSLNKLLLHAKVYLKEREVNQYYDMDGKTVCYISTKSIYTPIQNIIWSRKNDKYDE